MTQRKKPDKDVMDQINEAIKDPNVPKIYSNGFLNAAGQGDTLILLLQNGKPVAVLNLSYTVAKTLALKLGQLIKNTEASAGTTILTTEDFLDGFQKSSKQEDRSDESIRRKRKSN